jgi:hypothetical protein
VVGVRQAGTPLATPRHETRPNGDQRAVVRFAAVTDGRSYRGIEVLGWWHDEILASWKCFEAI